MLAYIAAHLQRSSTGAPIVLGSALYGSGHFYDASGKFSFNYTCNAWPRNAPVGRVGVRRVRRTSSLRAELRKLPASAVEQE